MSGISIFPMLFIVGLPNMSIMTTVWVDGMPLKRIFFYMNRYIFKIFLIPVDRFDLIILKLAC